MLSHQVDPPRLADQDRYSSSINLLMTRFQLFYHFFLSSFFVDFHHHFWPRLIWGCISRILICLKVRTA